MSDLLVNMIGGAKNSNVIGQAVAAGILFARALHRWAKARDSEEERFRRFLEIESGTGRALPSSKRLTNHQKLDDACESRLVFLASRSNNPTNLLIPSPPDGRADARVGL